MASNLYKNTVATLTIMGGVVLLLLGIAPAVATGNGSISGVVFEDTDHDGVQDAGEPPWTGKTVHLLSEGAAELLATTSTDADGRYSFDGLAEATYRVQYDTREWRDLREDWTPTTTGSFLPRADVTVAGAETLDVGWRRIIKSTDLQSPISTFSGPSGLRVDSFVDVIDAEAIHDVLATGTLGEEASSVLVRFGWGSNSTTTSSAGALDGTYTSYSAAVYVDWENWLVAGWTVLAHEYGHAWSNYYAHLIHQDPSFGVYLEARGLAGDERIGSTYAWQPAEMIAEDYRQLLGPGVGRDAPQVNRDVPNAADTPGLMDFLTGPFVGANDGGATTSSDPSEPTSSTTPDADSTLVASVGEPLAGSTVTGMVPVSVEVGGPSDPSQARVTVTIDGTLSVQLSFDPASGAFTGDFDSGELRSGDHVLVAVVEFGGADAASNPVSFAVEKAKGKGSNGGGNGNSGGGRGPKK